MVSLISYNVRTPITTEFKIGDRRKSEVDAQSVCYTCTIITCCYSFSNWNLCTHFKIIKPAITDNARKFTHLCFAQLNPSSRAHHDAVIPCSPKHKFSLERLRGGRMQIHPQNFMQTCTKLEEKVAGHSKRLHNANPCANGSRSESQYRGVCSHSAALSYRWPIHLWQVPQRPLAAKMLRGLALTRHAVCRYPLKFAEFSFSKVAVESRYYWFHDTFAEHRYGSSYTWL